MVSIQTGTVTGVLAYANGMLVANTTASQYFHQDPLGSVRLITTSSAGTAFASDYRPFGGQDNRAGTDQTVKFDGQFQSSSTSLYQMGVRWYDTSTGEFQGQDPVLGSLHRPQSLGRYSYTSGNPVNYADTSGLGRGTGAPDWMQELNENGYLASCTFASEVTCNAESFIHREVLPGWARQLAFFGLGLLRINDAQCQGINFASSDMDHVTFTNADLKDANWGLDGLDGPVISNVEFVNCDLRGSTYGHPRFLNCHWIRCNLLDVKFRGSRFEHCSFVGLLDKVWFRGWYRDSDPRIAGLRNPMTGVDFSAAELRWPAFTHGIDLTSCKFPSEGYIRIPHPRATYGLVLDRVRESLVGKERQAAVFYLAGLLKGHFRGEQPLDILRPQDLVESPMGRGAAIWILRALGDVLKERSTKGNEWGGWHS